MKVMVYLVHNHVDYFLVTVCVAMEIHLIKEPMQVQPAKATLESVLALAPWTTILFVDEVLKEPRHEQ
jgi:hypothetical protein